MAKKRSGQHLTLSQAETTVTELEDALEKHRQWIKKFQATLVCRIKPKAKFLKRDSHMHTAFGKWYGETENDYIRKHEDFAAMGKFHRRMHTVARKLAKAVEAEKPISPKNYDEFVVAVDAFKHSVRSVLLEAREMLRYTDSLTGLANRHMMKARLDQEQERALRRDGNCALGMMDLDHFKAVNDTYGHAVGDIVLKTVAHFMAANVRRYDQVFRFGGEEFLILMPDTEAEAASHVLDRLRADLAKLKIDIGEGRTLKITASFGVSNLDGVTPVIASIEKADAALYQAKQDGRNRVRVAE